MSESTLENYLAAGSQTSRIRSRHANIEATEECDLMLMGWLRGLKDRASWLELRLNSGNRVAIPYNLIERMEYDPSTGIRLQLTDRTITLSGANLNAEIRPGMRLFEGLVRQRVTWLRDRSGGEGEAGDRPALRISL